MTTINGSTGSYTGVGAYGANAYDSYQALVQKDSVAAENATIQISDLTPNGQPKVSNSLAWAMKYVAKYGGAKGCIDLADLTKITNGNAELAKKFMTALDVENKQCIGLRGALSYVQAQDRPLRHNDSDTRI